MITRGEGGGLQEGPKTEHEILDQSLRSILDYAVPLWQNYIRGIERLDIKKRTENWLQKK